MKYFILIAILFLTVSFSYDQFNFNSEKFEIKKIRDHHWTTDYDAFRSYQEFTEQRVFVNTNIPIEKLDIDLDFVKEKLEIFAGEKPFYVNGEEKVIAERGNNAGKDLARTFLIQEYEKLGYSVSIQGDNGRIKNFVAVREGEIKDKFVVLTSHMDSMWNAGADDNGSGTIGNLAVAKAIQDYDLKYSLKIIAFDVEEQGLVGSRYFVKNTDRNQILMNWNIDMIGYDGDKDRAIHIMDCDYSHSVHIKTRALLVVQELQLPVKVTKACTDRSDHASFWDYKIPAAMASENFFGRDGNVCYHKRCDKTDLIDYEYMGLLLELTGSTVLSFLQGY